MSKIIDLRKKATVKNHSDSTTQHQAPGEERITPPPEEKTGFWSQALEFSVELIKVVIISLAIVIPVRYFLIQPFYVKGASMEPSFYDHEYLIINEIVYRFEEPGRGDIVVFKYPRQPSQYFIKRIVALPGERVQIKDGKVTIFNKQYKNGHTLDESDYLIDSLLTSGEVDVVLEDDEYFVLGDNRNSSLDSRTFGPVPRKNIVGRTWLRGWPLNRITRFERPEYNL
ncbi:signal peptidase I [Patescibacteria group bacterium]|nr:signal peptidase I [Patescibacteria group bacterium]MBU4511869.1 signal peptidase I [Patescibacteria group bacterium]